MRLLLILCCCLFAAPVDAEGLQFGTFEGVLKDSDGKQFMRYQATVPGNSSRPLGLIVGLHGINGHERQLTGSLNKALAACKLNNEYMVLCLKSIGNGWEDVDHKPILQSIDWAIDTYQLDPRRVFGWGYSHGGFRYGVLGAEAQETFAGVVILGGGMRKPQSDLRSLHYYLIHGADDATVNVSSAHRSLDVLNQYGFPYVYRELTGEGHGVAGSHKSFESRCDALRYLHRLRNPHVALSPTEQAAIDEATEALVPNKRLSVKKIFPALPFIGGSACDAVLVKAHQINKEAKKEDYKILQAIGVTTQYYHFNQDVAQILGEALLHKKSKVKEAAVIALCNAAQWNHKDALNILISYISNKEIEDKERAVVIMRMGHCIPLQLTCNNVQKPLFQALIESLSSESSAIRTAAITALMGAANGEQQKAKVAAEQMSESPRSGFGYHPKASEEKRAESIQRWQNWLGKKS